MISDFMNIIVKRAFLLFLLFVSVQSVIAQGASDNIIRGKVFSDTDPALIGVVVSEIDPTNRVVTSTISDINGNFSLKAKSLANRVRISYVGFIPQIVAIGNKRLFNIKMRDATTISDVTITARKTTSNGTFDIPKREISTAVQTISSKEFEGLSVASVDDALQGRISGLDIVNGSGDLGSGSSMRIRGITSINSDSNPLLVVNGVIFETPVGSNFDFSTANQEQFASLLSVNVDDIESITVLKDAASTAIWGSRGASGVISITTKKGLRGKTKLQYSYRFSGAVQPQGMKMLTGDDYTMLMKEEYFNPIQDDKAADIREFKYDRTFSEYQNFNNNTDWIKAVSQFGVTHDHYVQLSGGGDRARFLISGGYYNQTGTVIKQNMERFTNRVNLDYNVSDRIKFSSEFSFTDTKNSQNYDKLLEVAYKLMPNMSIYAQDKDGNNTSEFYKMLLANTSTALQDDQMKLPNPVASANLAKKNVESLYVHPVFRIQYDLLNPEVQMLRFKSHVSFDVNNEGTYTFLPKELNRDNWASGGINSAGTEEKRSFSLSSESSLLWSPKFENKDHTLMLSGAYQFGFNSYKYQKINSYGAPNDITGSTAGGYVNEIRSDPAEGRWLAYTLVSHYVFKDKYIADFVIRRDGSSKFGDKSRWGTFPGVSCAWNVADEDFMKPTNKWLSTLKLRPSWGMTGKQPKYEYLFYSLYSSYSSYNGTATIRPENIQLSNLRWEKVTSTNLGLDFGFFDDAYTLDLDYYFKTTTDMLFEKVALPSSSGFGMLTYENVGRMDNNGWEINMQANKIIKAGDFSVTLNLNLSNYINTIREMKQSILNGYNGDFSFNNGDYLTRIQLNNSFGSIYGFKYKGVYQYNDYKPGREGKSPFALDAQGKIINDASGNPLRMVYAYGKSSQYSFKGGDAIYEDINHDGNINELDIVYLGNSNPLFNGGFGIKLFYRNFSANIFSNFRVGNKNVNIARMNAENMYSNNNQSASVNWRWRKDGDVTPIPRALYKSGYNWLASDRYVEDGSFFRVKYAQINYSIDSKLLKRLKISQMSLYLTMNNLFTFTKYSGVDPEVNFGTGISVDKGQTPRSQSFTAGVTIVL